VPFFDFMPIMGKDVEKPGERTRRATPAFLLFFNGMYGSPRLGQTVASPASPEATAPFGLSAIDFHRHMNVCLVDMERRGASVGNLGGVNCLMLSATMYFQA